MRTAGILALGMLLLAPLAFAGGPNPGAPAVRVEGVITAIDAGAQQIVVSGVTVQITPQTTLVMKGVPIAFEDLAVGMTVRACGLMSGDVLVAKNVSVMYLGQ
jgi:hypothetical protein